LNDSDFTDYLNGEKTVELITNNVVNGYLNYKKTARFYAKWMNTFTKFSNVLNGKNSSIKETVEFWQSSSFYNYVQAPTKGPRISPTKEEFKQSFDALSEVVEQLKPNMIFIWGDRLWNNFPKDNYESKKSGNDKIHYLKFSYNLPIMVVPHPSSSKFNYGIKKNITDYLNAVKTVGNTV
jgi:uracil-DNA glycosylase